MRLVLTPVPPVVLRMLKEDPHVTPFLLTGAQDDNSDEIISPYVLAAERITENVRAAIGWIEKVRAGTRAELWMTEGYDDQFQVLLGSASDLVDAFVTAAGNLYSLPSLRLIIS